MPPKSGHSRAKNIDYDEDDVYSDYEEEEQEGTDGMTDEDREQMRIGTINVREALDSSISVTDAQIQEALWHYYYDVGKSVTYLKNKSAPAKAKPATATEARKPKTVSRFDQAASIASVENKSAAGEQPPLLFPQLSRPVMHRTKIQPHYTSASPRNMADPLAKASSASKGFVDTLPSLYPVPAFANPEPCISSDFFWDTPWGNVPAERLGVFSVHPLLPKGRLLGGSSKPSKLAALAAARKRRQEDTNASSTTAAPNQDDDGDADKAVALLDRLSVKNKDTTTPASLRDGDGKDTGRRLGQGRYPLRKRQSSSPPEEPQVEADLTPQPVEPVIQFPGLRGGPSMFASTLCAVESQPMKKQHQFLDSLSLPCTGLDNSSTNPFAGPSPDDKVLSAQAKGSKQKAGQSKKANGDKLTESVEKLSMEETPRVKSKNLNVVEEFEKSGMKRMANFVVIGHVDHGKSTLMGRLLYDLKVIDQRSVDKLRKEAETIGKSSFALAWVMDQTSEERSRGVTVDIATNYFETDKTRFTILDAPGHKDFIPNMIAGASQADFAVLVIDASINSFESGLKGQTKEHALLVRSMGVNRLVVAINKMDTVSWSQERFKEIQHQMTAFLTGASFTSKSVTFVPLAGLTGENVASKVTDPNAKWYTGPSLIESLDASEPQQRSVEKPLRLTIGDVFRGGITNPISISGRIEAGSLQVGDPLICMPSNEKATVKAIEIENEPVDWAIAGQIPTLHLSDIDPVHLRMGDIVCDPKNPVKLVKEFTCKILAFDLVLPGSVDVFRGRLQAEGKIIRLVATLNKGTGEIVKKKPKVVKAAEVARVVVELDKELPLETGTRVVLREGGNTIAAGLLEG